MEKHTIADLMGITMTKIHEMVDVNTIVGQPVSTPDGTTVIPVSKVSFGFGVGGSDYEPRNARPEKDKNFGGGSGAGVSINPVAFLVVTPSGVRLLPVQPPVGSTVDRVVEAVPSLLEKISAMLKRGKGQNEE